MQDKYCKATENGNLVGTYKGSRGFPKKNSKRISKQEYNMIHLYSKSLKNQNMITSVLEEPSKYMYED